MYKCKYDTVELAIALIIIPDSLIIYPGIIFFVIALISNQINIAIFPWVLYAIIGSFLLITHMSYFIIYLLTRKICRLDDKNIVLNNGNEIINISKLQIEKIRYTKKSIFLAALYYDAYGSVVICCNAKMNYKKLRVKMFPSAIKHLHKLGYPVEYT